MIKELKTSLETRQITKGKYDKIGFAVQHDDNFDTLRFTFDTFIRGNAVLITDLEDEDGKPIELSMITNEDAQSYDLVITNDMLQNEDITFQLQITTEDFVWNSKKCTLPIFEGLEQGDGELPNTIQSWLVEANRELIQINNNAQEKIDDINELSLVIIDQEATRISNEGIRQENEASRIANETLRQDNEDDRVQKEANREAYIDDLKERVNRGEFKGERGEKGDEGERGEKGEKGDAGLIKFIIVRTLPTSGIDESAIYLVPSSNPETQNLYDEFVYTEDGWEQLGSTPIEIDLTDYVKNTDYATSSKGGVVKLNSNLLVGTTDDGRLYAYKDSYSNYETRSDSAFISKGTLENVLTGKGLVDKDDVRY